MVTGFSDHLSYCGGFLAQRKCHSFLDYDTGGFCHISGAFSHYAHSWAGAETAQCLKLY
jgi:hypothetical protein